MRFSIPGSAHARSRPLPRGPAQAPSSWPFACIRLDTLSQVFSKILKRSPPLFPFSENSSIEVTVFLRHGS